MLRMLRGEEEEEEEEEEGLGAHTTIRDI